jgi:hypothetical protein
MARKVIDIGTVGNDGTGDSIRDSFRKVNDNFRELYSSLGLGEKLTFIGLDDTPLSYVGQNDPETGATPVLTINSTESGIQFKHLRAGTGVSLDFTSNENEILINSEFSEISGDPSPQLGGNLSAKSGGEQYRILDLGTTGAPLEPIYSHEAVNKAYADSKLARAGVNAIDPATGTANSAFGTMTGPLILSRDPVPDDDEVYGGMIAATKRYVDNSAFGSTVNLYVATSGEDDRVGVSPALQGRALAYAYRTLEAALKRAEEIVLESRKEIGPYKKVLTYNNGVGFCELQDIDVAPSSGAGFSGQVLMSVDTISLSAPGTNYSVGDIITLSGGTFSEPARYEVLSVGALPGTSKGPVISFRQLSSGVYTALPGSSSVATISDSDFGAGARFNVTYRVNNAQVLDGGSGYGLVSVRIEGGGGSGAFGTADVVGGIVQSITITDGGSGFTNLPNVVVNLPRFLIKTDGYRTDFTGDVTTGTPTAIRGRDIREGLYLRGESSGALAQILSHSGELDSLGNEIFDVDILYGTFELGETISYGDFTKTTQITILVESGIYEENLPLRVPQNVSIVGNEFRRCIIRPKPGVSSSPWAFTYFRREPEINGLTVATQLYGYHYLTDSTAPVYPLVNNKGYYRSAAELLRLNRQFIQQQVIGWINHQIANNIAPYTSAFQYDSSLCERDVGLILDSMIFDLKWGGSNRTVSAGLKYYGNASGRLAITTQLSETTAAIRRINTLAQLVIKNIQVTELYSGILPQIVDGAYIAEVGAVGTSINITNVSNADPIVVTTSTDHGLSNGDQVVIGGINGTTEINGNDYYVTVLTSTSFTIHELADRSDQIDSSDFGVYASGGTVTEPRGVVGALIDALIDVIDGSGSVNYPKDNDQMDMFLCNDAVRFQALTFQGHGGFGMVLDPEGQILAKSPYAQECASFTKSTGVHTFAGGQFIDGFTGNLKFEILSKDSNTFLRVGGLKRMPNVPCSFIVNDNIYRINYIRDWTFNTAGSTASFILDETTPWTFDLFTYDPDICSRDVGYIIDGLGYDMVLGTNYNARKAGLTYRQANAAVVINDQLTLTVAAIEEAHDIANGLLDGYSSAQLVVQTSKTSIANVVQNGATFAPSLTFTNPTGVSTNVANAKSLLFSNIAFIKDETIGWMNAQIAGNIAPFSTLFTYDSVRCARDVGYIIEAVVYDLLYGGNSQTRDAALKYYDGVGSAEELQLAVGQEAETAAAVDYASYLAQRVVQNLAPASTYSSTPRVTGTAASAAEATIIDNLMTIISDVITGGTGSAPTVVYPDLDAYVYSTALKSAKVILDTEKAAIQSGTIAFVEDNANIYEVLMPGNRSMLGNDYTQINDMGYGVIVTNGGLCEAVSMFSYYCYISMYSLNGGQIRSVASSSAHGVYALVAEGADPLEIPTPVTLYYDLAQGAECYNDGGTYTNVAGGLQLYVTNYTYAPLNNGELEVDHGYAIYRYPITSVSTDDLPAGVAKLNLSASEGAGVDGLFDVIPNGTKLTIRQNSQTVLTGDVVEVATRPSTGLVLRESPDVYRILQFEAYNDPNGARTFTISIADPAVISKVGHGLQPGYQISLATTGSLPTGVTTADIYYVLADNWTEDSFQIGATKGGTAIATSGSQSGVHSYTVEGLARTTLRENYNYVDLTVWPTQPYESSGTCTISIANPAVVTQASHGLSVNDVVRFETTGSLPSGLTTTRMYFVESILSGSTFTVTASVGGSPIETTGTQSGVHTVGKVIGNVGDNQFAVVPVGPDEEARILGSKLVWIGEEYEVVAYDNESVTGQPYALLTLNPALIDSVVLYNSMPTLKSAVPKDEPGTLTIRISLTRVTGHDLLEIGTGSYADTNYPNEIYGAAVNALNAAAETEERGVGRCFYVTTDQFGNFNVGPYFRVDQGTGRVTFSAAIALSNLDGIGFKRGVPIAEFSTDSAFSDNATDTVPTENAARTYIERRLGLSHTGSIVPAESLIPSITGGYMALDGQLAMKGALNLDNNRVINVSDPVDAQDAVNLRSLTWANFQDSDFGNIQSADLVTFTGDGNNIQNSTVVGDISLSIDSTAHTIDAQIVPNTIIDADINSAAAIAQSKLNMTAASTRANATGITQADRGLASFDSAEFTVTNGWVTLKDNGTPLSALPQLGADTVLGNSSASTANVTSVTFATVVNEGLAIKKSNYTTTGYLRRKNSLTSAGDTGNGIGDSYEMVEESSTNTVSTLVKRDSNGDFAGRVITGEQFKLDTKLFADTTTSGGGGVMQLYGYSGQAAILLGDGSLSTDKRNYYDNEGHIFRPQNGVGYAPITASSIQVTALTTGGTGTAGTITGNWSLSAGSRLQATYADLAEYYKADKEYPPGTVLVFGGSEEVTTGNTYGDSRVAGVVTTEPAYVMNSGCEGTRACIALQGRVPCKVVGKVNKGDLLVTSNIPGVAVAAKGDVKAGTIIGKSLSNFDSDHIGTIEVAVGRA